MSQAKHLAQRRARVEAALLREGDGLDISQLARELGVAQRSVRRDVAYVRAAWAASSPDLEGERARTIAEYEAVIAAAWEQYHALVHDNPQHATTTSCLRVIADTRSRLSKLAGIDEPPDSGQAGALIVIVEHVYPPGAPPIPVRPPGGYRSPPSALQSGGDGPQERQDDDGRLPDQS